jgi:glucosamine-6-phosphate deaminase
MTVHVYETREQMGAAAAAHAAERMRDLGARYGEFAMVFATGASQLETLRALVQIPNLPWDRVTGFHMDEYIGIPADHPASFRRYLRNELTSRVPLRAFHEVEGDIEDAAAHCTAYAARLRAHAPRLCLLGIGENGHLAFNDPGEADFADREDVKVVTLDRACRQQQVNEGWFAALEDVPEQAITLTIPSLLRIPELILSVPGTRKAAIVRRTLEDEITPACPATILRTHANSHLYLDRESHGAN